MEHPILKIIVARIGPNHAIAQPSDSNGKTDFFKKEGAASEAQILAHLDGESEPLAVWITEAKAETTRQAVLDFDNKGLTMNAEDLKRLVILIAKFAYEEYGLKGLIARSRSGNGYHIWFYWEEPQRCEHVRGALEELLGNFGLRKGAKPVSDHCVDVFVNEDHGVCFPCYNGNPLIQYRGKDEANEVPWGNAGGNFWQYSNPVAPPSKPKQVDKRYLHLTTALEFLKDYATDYNEWIAIGIAIKNTFGDLGYPIWSEWSKNDPQHDNETDLRDRWSSFHARDENVDRGPSSIGSIFEKAQKKGWTRPNDDDEQWEPPINIFEDHILAEWPDEPILGVECDNYIDAISDTYPELERGALASAILVVTAMVAGSMVRVELVPGREMRLNLYSMLIGDSGVGKTPVIEYAAVAPNAIQKELELEDDRRLKQYTIDVKRYTVKKRAFERRYNAWLAREDDLERGDEPVPPDAPPPVHRRWLYSTTGTGEGFSRLRSEWTHSPNIIRDELKALFGDLNRPNMNSNFEFLLESATNAAIRKVLADEDRSYGTDGAYCNILGGIQPGLIPSVATEENLENGMQARIALPWRMVRRSDEYQLKLASIDDRAYVKRMKAIFRTFVDLRESVVLPLTDEAREIFIDYAGRWKREVNNVGGGPTVASISKWDIFAPRIAALLHLLHLPIAADGKVAELGDDYEVLPIPAIHMERACRVLDKVYRTHVKAMYAFTSKNLNAARKVAEKVVAKPKQDTWNEGDLKKGLSIDEEDWWRVTRLLIDYRIIRQTKKEKSGRGRRTTKWEINPFFFAQFSAKNTAK